MRNFNIVPRDTTLEAVRIQASIKSMFNVIDYQAGWKADLVIGEERPFSLEEFRRWTPMNRMGLSVFVVSPEDAILSKLE
jgi:hypothetical protein